MGEFVVWCQDHMAFVLLVLFFMAFFKVRELGRHRVVRVETVPARRVVRATKTEPAKVEAVEQEVALDQARVDAVDALQHFGMTRKAALLAMESVNWEGYPDVATMFTAGMRSHPAAARQRVVQG
jgi:hypothetical protein